VTKGDAVIERGADRLAELAERSAAQGGLRAKLADDLASDAAFLRKLKPSLIAARIRGDRPIVEPPGGAPTVLNVPAKPTKAGAGPNPFLIGAAAFAVGMLLAKVIDWRGHAHPRD
jgi:hypothetical protein